MSRLGDVALIAAIGVVFVATGIVFWLPDMHTAGHEHHGAFAMAIGFFVGLWALAYLSTPAMLDRWRRAWLGLAAALFGMMTFLVVVGADGVAHEVPSAARVIVTDRVVLWLVPVAELPRSTALFARHGTFWHLG